MTIQIDYDRPGNTPRFRNNMLDYDGVTPLDPDTQSVQIFDGQKNLVTTISKFIRDAPGNYYFYYTIPTDAIRGTWTLKWTAISGGLSSVSTFDFEVAP